MREANLNISYHFFVVECDSPKDLHNYMVKGHTAHLAVVFDTDDPVPNANTTSVQVPHGIFSDRWIPCLGLLSTITQRRCGIQGGEMCTTTGASLTLLLRQQDNGL